MKKCRKIVSLCLLIPLVLSSCNNKDKNDSKNDNKNEPVTVTLWHYYNGVQLTTFDRYVKEFNETVGLQEGIVVEAFSKNTVSNLAESVIMAVNDEPGADNPPDIFATYSETAYILDQKGVLADLGQYFTEDELDEYVDGYISEGMFGDDGELKIFPTAKSTELMMLNATEWEKFSRSCNLTVDDMKTWEGLCEVARIYYDYTDALTPEVKNDGKAFFGRDSVANYMVVGAAQLGNEFITVDSEGTTLKIDKGTIRRLWDCYYVPYVSGYFTAQGRYRSDDIKTGEIVAMVCSTTGAAYFPSEVTINDDYTYPVENLILPVPNFMGTSSYLVQQGAGMSVIKSDERTQQASAIFLKWFTEEERNIEFSLDSGYMPVKKSANDFEKILSKCSEDEQSTLMRSVRTAVEGINSAVLYSAEPFDNSTTLRSCLESYIQETAEETFEIVKNETESGASREEVLAVYTGDEAFDEWFEIFKEKIEKAVYGK